jgi:hypothetical protein
MSTYEIDEQVPAEVRAFGWSMITVHLQKLNWLAAQYPERAESLEIARRYLRMIAGDSPDDPEFVEWCIAAMEFGSGMLETAREPVQPEVTTLKVIQGGKAD